MVMPRALFVLRTKAAVLENLPTALALRGKNYVVEFLVDPAYAREQLPLICEAGFPAFHPSGKQLDTVPARKEGAASGEQHAKAHATLCSSSLRERCFRALPSIVRDMLHYHSRLQRMRRFLVAHSPDIVILSGDHQLGWELACIKAANELHLPSLITPYAVQFAEGIAVCRAHREDYVRHFRVSGILRHIVARVFPDWTFRYRGERMLYYPVAESLAAWLLGLMPSNPWTIGGGSATRMAVESEYARKIFSEDGVADEHMVTTGKPCNDDIAQAIAASSAEAVRAELGIPAGNQVLLCSIPQLAEHGLLSWEEHLKEVDFLLSTFALLPQVSVLLSLHPKSDLARYQPLVAHHGAQVALQRIYTLQPACDVFVAGVSSTVTQAIGIAKPSIVIDYFGLDDRHYYDDAPGVVMVREHEQLRPALKRVLHDRPYYDDLVAAQKREGDRWALMDGRCTERMVTLIEEMIAR